MDLDSAMTGLLRGNAFFSSGSYAAARNAYSRAVDGLEGPGGGGASLRMLTDLVQRRESNSRSNSRSVGRSVRQLVRW